MLRKLLLILLTAGSLHTLGQIPRENPGRTPKATEKDGDTQIDYKKIGSPMPAFRLIVCRDSANNKFPNEVLTNDDLDNGANLFVMMFNPTCSHCQDETATIEQSIGLFKKSRLVLSATPPMKQYVSDFIKLLHISSYPQITVGIDSADYLNKAFMYQMLPQIDIYDKKRKLIRIFTGDVAIDSLKQYIQ